ncbi:MAG TPA: hypothetical protein DE147_14350 [Gammaproteobacteria bacterium]|jgi:hypothetical protein|nr:hypothetical protein [Gammaproteobacteria bacterium]
MRHREEAKLMNPTFQDPSVVAMQWVFVGVLAVSLLVLAFLRKRASAYVVTALPLVALASHQVEEYLLAPLVLGNDYHFLNWAFRSGLDISPMTVVSVNLLGYFGATILYVLRPATLVFALVFLFINAMALGNGVFHIGVATVQSGYSPGMITALFMFLPLYIKSVMLASEQGASLREIFGLSLYGFVAHFVLIWLVK